MRSIRLPSWTERLLGLEPQPVPPHVFSLDDRHLRYGGFSTTSDGLSFETYQHAPMPAKLFASGPLGGPVRDTAVLDETLSRFLEGLGTQVREANLILPDAWLRLLFTEVEELPQKQEHQEEVVRFKLRRLVPFRPEELRIAWTEVAALPGQESQMRLLVGFAIEALITQIERAFNARGIHLGQVTNATLASLTAIGRRVPPKDLCALFSVDDDAYSIAYIRQGEPLLYRYKALGDMPDDAIEAVVRRNLHLTRAFVEEHVPDVALARVVLATAPNIDPMPWTACLEDELGARVESVGMEHLPLAQARTDLPWQETAMLTGGAAVEVG